MIHKTLTYSLLIAANTILSACQTNQTDGFDYTKYYALNPRSILVVPVINNSVEVNAADYFLTTISKPLAERGYYVFPINLVKRLMEDDGLADAAMVHQADPTRLGELFGADAIMYITIEKWETKYIIVNSTVYVEFLYVLKSARSGETIWSSKQNMTYSPKGHDTGNLLANIIVSVVQAAATKAAPNYIPLSQKANALAVNKANGVPPGPYDENYWANKPQDKTSNNAADGSEY